MFDDLFSPRGRRSVPPRVVATVMVLQRWFGLSDREAVAAFEFDLRWRYACGGLDSDGGGFCHTVLVGMRARLAASDRPRRIFEAVLEVARSAGALSQNPVLDSAPIYDAVATQDTVTMLRAAIRGVLEAAGDAEGAVRGLLAGGDGYASRSKPACDWADAHAREALVARIAADADAVLEALEGRALSVELAQAAQLLAAVVGQDLHEDPEGRFQIARRVARDRIISVVDRDARHGHKTAARGFDGYKGHIATDPDSELITATAVTAANAPDARPAPELIADLLDTTADTDTDPLDTGADTADSDTDTTDTIADSDTTADSDSADAAGVVEDFAGRPTVYGDCAYGSGDFQSLLSEHRINSKCRTRLGAASPRTASASTCAPRRSPVPRRSPSPSASAPTARAPPTSATPAPTANCAATAPQPKPAEPYASARTRPCSPRRAPANGTPHGETTTAPRAPKSNANSRTSCAENTAAATPACAANPKSTPTSTSSPQPPTSPASARSDCTPPPTTGPSCSDSGIVSAPNTPNPRQHPHQ